VRGLAIDVAAWSSPWRHRPPGDKVLLAFGLVLCALVLPVWPGSPLVAVTAVAAAVGPAQVGWRVLARAGRAALAFIVLGGVSIAITWQAGSAGGAGPALLGLTVTTASAGQAAATMAHAVGGTAAMLLLATTTPITDLLAWARRRGVPEAVVDVAGLIYRLLFVLLATAQAVRAAQTARLGYATRRAALRSAAALTAAILTRAWTRARRLEEGLAGRGLDGPLRVLEDARPSSPRFVAASLVVLATVAVVSLTTHAMVGPILTGPTLGGSSHGGAILRAGLH
jgi:cobalt/nickel transport system permease protein